MSRTKLDLLVSPEFDVVPNSQRIPNYPLINSVLVVSNRLFSSCPILSEQFHSVLTISVKLIIMPRLIKKIDRVKSLFHFCSGPNNFGPLCDASVFDGGDGVRFSEERIVALIERLRVDVKARRHLGEHLTIFVSVSLPKSF